MNTKPVKRQFRWGTSGFPVSVITILETLFFFDHELDTFVALDGAATYLSSSSTIDPYFEDSPCSTSDWSSSVSNNDNDPVPKRGAISSLWLEAKKHNENGQSKLDLA